MAHGLQHSRGDVTRGLRRSGEPARLFRSPGQLSAAGVCALLGVALFAFVDLTPRVEADFFFSTGDPQVHDSRRVETDFGEAPQVFIAARSGTLASGSYIRSIHTLTEALRAVDGIADVRSLTRGLEEPEDVLEEDPAEVFEDLADSPFWSRLILAPDRSATFIVLRLGDRKDGAGQEQTVAAIDDLLDRHSRAGFELGASGVPYVSEHIRRRLADDLRLFSIAAFAVFALLVAILFRSLAILVGTMVAALTASFGTFLVRALAGLRTDVLAPNLWMIAFVLTLSHIVYLTARWRMLAREKGGDRAVERAIRAVGPASGWSLVANLLGFSSLIFVSAQPLRQFGISGAIAAVLAMVCAYVAYPPFLRAARAGTGAPGAVGRRLERFFTTRHPWLAMLVVAMAVALAPFAWRVNTDPALPTYFSSGDRIRTGLEAVDRAGGSSPLDIVVAAAGGGGLDNDDRFEQLQTLQRRLEEHPDVGAALSIALLMAETERPWYSFLFSWEARLDRLDSPSVDRIGRTFMSEDRTRGRFILRMHEIDRSRPRAVVVSEIEGLVREHGFEPVAVGGLYPLQGELSELVEGSVIRGLGGLIGVFFLIVLIVTRSLWSALIMTVCLAVTPFALFGLVGLFGMPLDIISAPAANVALPLGIDEMIHLGYAVRRSRPGAGGAWQPWKEALARLWAPILASALIVASGFMLFMLSSFPPTQRLGILVCIGAVLTDLVVLVALPALATGASGFSGTRRFSFRRSGRSGSRAPSSPS